MYYIKTWTQKEIISTNEDRHLCSIMGLQMYYIKIWIQRVIVYYSRDRHLFSKMATNVQH
jgi:hypothetical protein